MWQHTGELWCGVRFGQPLPPDCGFSEVWQLHFGSPPGLTRQAILVQTDQTVRGSYVDSEGHMGEIVDGVITVQSITEAKLTGRILYAKCSISVVVQILIQQ